MTGVDTFERVYGEDSNLQVNDVIVGQSRDLLGIGLATGEVRGKITAFTQDGTFFLDGDREVALVPGSKVRITRRAP